MWYQKQAARLVDPMADHLAVMKESMLADRMVVMLVLILAE